MPVRSTKGEAVPFAKPVANVPRGSLRALRTAAADCRQCPLWRNATQTVFGRGAAHATVMLIGEQPGNEEDLQGRPFVGPAGRLLDRVLEEAGLERDALYLTNTVKHFKFERRGKARLHKRANAGEQAACRPWLAAEWSRIRPRWVVALGAMAAQTVFGNAFRLTQERGKAFALDGKVTAMATWHPAAVLRAPSGRRERLYRELLGDLMVVSAALRR